MLFIIKAARRITNIVITGLLYLLEQVQLVAWDLFLSFFNIVLPSLRPTAVIPAGSPGAGGQWPEYISPKDGDSRGACPALNALANHGKQSLLTPSLYFCTTTLKGILPHDGKNITFRQATNATRVYNHSPSFRYFIPKRMADILNRDYWTDTFDLSDINVHNGIEHDASFSRMCRLSLINLCSHTQYLRRGFLLYQGPEQAVYFASPKTPCIWHCSRW